MPARPWYPRNPGDYRRDTAHLTLEQHGAYNLLLDFAWDHDGVIPKDFPAMARVLGVHTNKARSLWEVLSQFWYETRGGYRQKRVDRELAKAIDISKERAEAGRRGGLAKAKQLHKQTPSKSQPTTTEEKRNPPLGDKEKTRSTRGTRLPADWIPPEEYLSWARENGNGLDLAYEVAEFRDFWSARAGRDSTKLDWFATWRNHIRRQAKHHRPRTHENGRRLTPAERGLLAMKED